MDLQKKRSSTKKTKQSKIDVIAEIPLAPLMQQINQLKSQLASIKSKKNLKSTKNLESGVEKQLNGTITSMNSPKSESRADKTLEELYNQCINAQKLKQIMFPIKDNQIKINLELSRLYQLLKEKDDSKALSLLVRVVNSLNISIRQLELQNRKITENVGRDTPVNWREQAKVYQQLNNQLQKQNIQLKHLLAKQIDDLDALAYSNEGIKQEYEELARNVLNLQTELQKSKILCEGLRQQRRELQEKIRIYERSIQKKQSQILMYEQDINFTRIQADKHKSQKRQIEKLFDNLQKQYREFKNKSEIDLQSLTKQKNKWKNQCEIRRANEQDNLGQQQQRTHLKKQVETSRKEMTILIEQLQVLKQKLCSEQKKNLCLEEKQFKLATQNEKLQRNIEYCRLEMKQMAGEVQELREQGQKYREIATKNKLGVKNTGKSQALQQIQDLIRMHKRDQQEQ